MPRPSRLRGLLLLAILVSAGCRAGDPGATAPAVPPVPRFVTSVGLEFQYIPGGTFTMGGPDTDAQPRHAVTLSPFYVARELLPKRIFRRFCAETGRRGNREELGPDPAGWVFENEQQWNALPGLYLASPTEDHAVKYQTLTDAHAFAAWLSRTEGRRFRVITEAQAEYVLRANTAQGDEECWWWPTQPGAEANWRFDGNYSDAGPNIRNGMVRLYPANPFGIYLNSLWIWTQDRYGSYPSGPQVDPTGPWMTTHGRYVVRRGPLWSRRASLPDAEDAGILLVADVTPADHRAAPAPAPVVVAAEPVETLPEQVLDLGGGVSLTLRQVPPGRFTLGRSQRERPWTREWPETEMELGAYALGTTEVTQAQFRAVTGINPSLVSGDDLPVHAVIMAEMLAFGDLITARERAAGRLGADEVYRLPTEAEWERAALAGRRTRFAHGDAEEPLSAYAWYDDLGGPRPVASKLPNRWGFYDMQGNMLEIMCEMMNPYPGTLQQRHWKERGRGWPASLGWYVARGGAWNMGAVACEPTLRRAVHVNSRTYFMGFRLARGPAMPEWDGKNYRVPWAEIFILAPYRATRAYAAVMQSAPPTWPRPADWTPPAAPTAP